MATDTFTPKFLNPKNARRNAQKSSDLAYTMLLLQGRIFQGKKNTLCAYWTC